MEPALSLPAVAAKAHYTVGVAMARLGRLDQTIRLYERAIELDPCYVAAIEELTGYLLSQRRTGDAVRVFRLSVKSGCDDPRVLHSLAKLLATSSNPSLRNGSEAVDLCARLLRTHGADPVLLQTYAAALAESGRFAEAIEEARRASGIAERAGPAGLAEAIREQIEGYQADRAYHDPQF